LGLRDIRGNPQSGRPDYGKRCNDDDEEIDDEGTKEGEEEPRGTHEAGGPIGASYPPSSLACCPLTTKKPNHSLAPTTTSTQHRQCALTTAVQPNDGEDEFGQREEGPTTANQNERR